MSETKQQKVARLAGELHDARMKYHMIGLQNSWGLSPDKARQQSVDYAIARANVLSLERQLSEAEAE